MPTIEHVFIDLDDTLWDFRSNSHRALEIVFRQLAVVRFYSSADEFYRVYSEKNTELWSLYHHGRITREQLVVERFRYPLQRVGVYDPQLVSDLNQAYLSTLAEQVGLNFFAIELLQYLSQHYSLTMVSNGFHEVQYRKITNSGLSPFFDNVVLSDEVGALKPDPTIFRHALQLYDALPSQAIMIGDNFEADILGAARAGIAQIYYNPLNKSLPDGLNPTWLQVPAPTYEVASLRDILDIL